MSKDGRKKTPPPPPSISPLHDIYGSLSKSGCAAGDGGMTPSLPHHLTDVVAGAGDHYGDFSNKDATPPLSTGEISEMDDDDDDDDDYDRDNDDNDEEDDDNDDYVENDVFLESYDMDSCNNSRNSNSSTSNNTSSVINSTEQTSGQQLYGRYSNEFYEYDTYDCYGCKKVKSDSVLISEMKSIQQQQPHFICTKSTPVLQMIPPVAAAATAQQPPPPLSLGFFDRKHQHQQQQQQPRTTMTTTNMRSRRSTSTSKAVTLLHLKLNPAAPALEASEKSLEHAKRLPRLLGLINDETAPGEVQSEPAVRRGFERIFLPPNTSNSDTRNYVPIFHIEGGLYQPVIDGKHYLPTNK